MIHINTPSLSSYTFIDLFSGIGGFHLALNSFGAKCVYACEWDKFAKQVYTNNFNITPDDDITKVKEDNIPDHDILCAGFPCQPFSISGKQLGFNDCRGTLFFDIARIINAKKPKLLILENVKNLISHNNGDTFKTIYNTLSNLNYNVFYKVLNAADFNIPQHRERLFIVGVRKDIPADNFTFPEPITLERHLEDCLLNNNDADYLFINNHKNLNLFNNNINVKYDNKPIRIGYVNKGYQGERIYSPKGVAITLSANGGGLFSKTGGYLINDKVRKLHPIECARIMGFPDDFKLCDNKNQAYKQFGNAVVVDVVQYILLQIINSNILYEK